MPASMMTIFPQMQASLHALLVFFETSVSLAKLQQEFISQGRALTGQPRDECPGLREAWMYFLPDGYRKSVELFLKILEEGWVDFEARSQEVLEEGLERVEREGKADIEFLELFAKDPPPQAWSFAVDDRSTLLDLPGLKLIDLSAPVEHRIGNYAVVFSPRAGHHSNIAERVALYLRSRGLTRMAVVEQKCAEDIPLFVQGRRHHEDFDGQLDQYAGILRHLKERTGCAAHLIAVCQPGPLLMATLILHPELGKTYGSAGSPMDTEGEPGFLGDFSRLVGEQYIDWLLEMFPRTVPEGLPGAGRRYYDGRLQVLGFYALGIEQHWKNFQRLLEDLRSGNSESARRQVEFYEWYNFVFHAPAGFTRDTFKRVFVRNELARGTFSAEGRTIGYGDYPATVPIWALGGRRDDITPPLVATGHMDRIRSVPAEKKLTLLCDAGHMGIFRSSEVLRNQYAKVAEFLLANSEAGK